MDSKLRGMAILASMAVIALVSILVVYMNSEPESSVPAQDAAAMQESVADVVLLHFQSATMTLDVQQVKWHMKFL